MELAWWQKPIRMMRRDYLGDFSYYLTADLGAMAREAKERWHINCEWIMATPGCAPGTAHLVTFNSRKFDKVPGLGDFDIIRSYLPHAKKYGIHLVPYINQHWYSYEFAKNHPEYTQQLLEDGTPYGEKYPLYGNGTTFCVNGPWREFAFEIIRETIRLEVDGCFLDGPVIFPKCCYCEHCRTLFYESSALKEMPPFGDWNHKAWKPFLKFRRESWVRFLKDAQAAARAVNPEAVIFLNGGRFDTYSVKTARDISGMEKYQNFSGAEEFYHVTESYKSPFDTLNLGRFLSAGEKPGVVFTHHTLSSWHKVPLSKPEMTLAMTETVASGANTWFAIFMEAMESRAKEAFEANDIQKFFAEHEEFYTATESAAETALLTSADTLYGYISERRELFADAGSGKEENLVADIGDGSIRESLNERRTVSESILDKELHGAFDAANFSHIPVRVFWDNHVSTDKLKDMAIFVLPNSACLSDKQVEVIMEYVYNGGSLAAFFESGFYDETGRSAKRTEWLEFLGIEKIKGAFRPAAYEEYMLLYGDNLPGMRRDRILAPRTYNALKIIPGKDSKILARFLNEIGGYYAKTQGVSEFPAVILSERGKGKVAYCSGTLFESFTKFHLDDHLDVYKSIMRTLSADSRLQIETDAPGSLAVEIRRNEKYTLVHLINTTGDMKRPIGRIVPLKNVDFSVRFPKKPRSVRAAVSRTELEFEKTNGYLKFKVPEIAAYELVVIE